MIKRESLPKYLLLDFVAMRLNEVEHQQVLRHLAEHEKDLLRVEALWDSELSAVPAPPIDLKKRILQQTIWAKSC